MNFDNLAFHEFLAHYVPPYSTFQYRINGSNLKLLGQSKVFCENLREVYKNHFNRPFKIDLKELLTVIDDPFLPAKMVSIRDENYFDLWRFDTFERLERLEHVLGRPVSELIYPSYDYFKHRHIFNYLVLNGKKPPAGLTQETRELVDIDFEFIRSVQRRCKDNYEELIKYKAFHYLE